MPVNTHNEVVEDSLDIAEEWRRLGEQRREFLAEADGLRRKLASLPQDPEIQGLLQKKKELQRKIPAIKDEIGMCDWEINSVQFQLDRRRAALTSPKLQQELAIRLQQRRERLVKLLALNAPEVTIVDAKRMVFEVEASFEEVEVHLTNIRASSEQKRDEARRDLDAVLAEVETIKHYYSETQHCLEEAIRQADQRARACRTEQVELAVRDRTSLKWALQHEPSFRDDVVHLYRLRFPADDLTDLFPLRSAPVIAPRGSLKRRHMQSHPKIFVPAAKDAGLAPLPWKFRVTFNEKEDGQILPSDRKQFLVNLRVALAGRTDLVGISAEKIYEKLMAITGMNIVERQRLKQIVGEDEELRNLSGWKTVKAEGRFRLFLLINEEGRSICFLPRRRRDAYSEH